MAEKMQGCPFFAGISREKAPEALQQHKNLIEERKVSGKIRTYEA